MTLYQYKLDMYPVFMYWVLTKTLVVLPRKYRKYPSFLLGGRTWAALCFSLNREKEKRHKHVKVEHVSTLRPEHGGTSEWSQRVVFLSFYCTAATHSTPAGLSMFSR